MRPVSDWIVPRRGVLEGVRRDSGPAPAELVAGDDPVRQRRPRRVTRNPSTAARDALVRFWLLRWVVGSRDAEAPADLSEHGGTLTSAYPGEPALFVTQSSRGLKQSSRGLKPVIWVG